ncbi:predicted protein [Sclerotinia sclerotiorum 1980 UF-70]|uniref:Uncharacterized protein n=1 Tax=Sclerotinia sclerotiorum (strain ATCC 18683 / 1980 / Ss-1) TaxID=665079 RepID=A7EN19_SCLS1|nr:predicted protein [Sclerotinia sclerotiorum 1980 UF-70]EDO04235.1 predicted protein [Sclerotinia sclerotiorum 1980 UF-70]
MHTHDPKRAFGEKIKLLVSAAILKFKIIIQVENGHVRRNGHFIYDSGSKLYELIGVVASGRSLFLL